MWVCHLFHDKREISCHIFATKGKNLPDSKVFAGMNQGQEVETPGGAGFSIDPSKVDAYGVYRDAHFISDGFITIP
ncbi:hypothetical protein AGMMS49944_17480 [Spirochaetia bacterium]|nr:hypothetical protein AGMMS49944_17480 [Spirochaetia bacterium]